MILETKEDGPEKCSAILQSVIVEILQNAGERPQT